MKTLFSIFIWLMTAASMLHAQDTFSIVAVDPETGEVGSAGATCLDTVVEGVSAIIISDVIPGVGAIHTQSYLNPDNKVYARSLLALQLPADQIMDSLVANDAEGNPAIRQYGVALFNASGNEDRAAFTGVNCFDWKGHFLGADFAVQGNILLGEKIIDSMAIAFFFEEGDLADKLMAAMQGANVPGADTRCLSPQNTSSRSAFIRVARPGDSTEFYLDINIGATDSGVEPIDVLQDAFDDWRLDNPPVVVSGTSLFQQDKIEVEIAPNPAGQGTAVNLKNVPLHMTEIEVLIVDLSGRLMGSVRWTGSAFSLSDFSMPGGLYLAILQYENRVIGRTQFTWED